MKFLNLNLLSGFKVLLLAFKNGVLLLFFQQKNLNFCISTWTAPLERCFQWSSRKKSPRILSCTVHCQHAECLYSHPSERFGHDLQKPASWIPSSSEQGFLMTYHKLNTVITPNSSTMNSFQQLMNSDVLVALAQNRLRPQFDEIWDRANRHIHPISSTILWHIPPTTKSGNFAGRKVMWVRIRSHSSGLTDELRKNIPKLFDFRLFVYSP